MRESIDYAICLNSVGSWDSELLIHVSKPPDNAYIKQIFEVNKVVYGLLQWLAIMMVHWLMDASLQGFSNVAEDLGFQVALKHKKINISNSRVSQYSTFWMDVDVKSIS